MSINLIIDGEKIRQIPTEDLEKTVNMLRGTALTMIHDAKSGHPGGSFSLANIFFAYLLENDYDDNFHLSKGHAAPLVYAAGYHFGNITDEMVANFRKTNGLSGHIDRFCQMDPSGLLGMGGGIINGYALANKAKGLEKKVYGVFGDGETDEPLVFSAIREALDFNLNVCYIIDNNGKNLTGNLVPHFENFIDSINSYFGDRGNIFYVENDVIQLRNAFSKIQELKGPTVMFVYGDKGQGVQRFVDDKSGWHGSPVTDEIYTEAMNELGQTPTTFLEDTKIEVMPSEYTNALAKLEDRFGTEKIATRKANEVLSEIDDEKIYVIIPDIGGSVCVNTFKEKHPERFLDPGISEEISAANALGLALKGFKPVIATFDAFAYYAFPVIHHADYAKVPFMSINFTHAEFVGEDGATHTMTNDLGAWNGLENLKVISNCPCYNQSVQAIRTPYENPDALGLGESNIIYHRLMRPKLPVLYDKDNLPQPGKADVIIPGKDIAIITTGQEVWESMIASEMLAQKGISASVVNVGYLKPLDIDTIVTECIGKDVYVVEAHNPKVGLASMIYNESWGSLMSLNSFNTIGIEKPVNSDTIENQKKAHKLDAVSLYQRMRFHQMMRNH